MIKGEKVRFDIHNILFSIYKFNNTLESTSIKKIIDKHILEKFLKKCKLIIDHDGAWKKYNLKNNYHLSGDRGWI